MCVCVCILYEIRVVGEYVSLDCLIHCANILCMIVIARARPMPMAKNASDKERIFPLYRITNESLLFYSAIIRSYAEMVSIFSVHWHFLAFQPRNVIVKATR